MEQRLVLLLASGAIGLLTLAEMLEDRGLDELQKLDFLLAGSDETDFGIYRIEMPQSHAQMELPARLFIDSTVPMYRQIEYKGGRRFPFRKDIKQRGL